MASRGLLHSRRKISDVNSLSGVNLMTTSNSTNRQTSNPDDTFVNAAYSHSVAVFSALYYPSLAGNCWDDELLPSGD